MFSVIVEIAGLDSSSLFTVEGPPHVYGGNCYLYYESTLVSKTGTQTRTNARSRDINTSSSVVAKKKWGYSLISLPVCVLIQKPAGQINEEWSQHEAVWLRPFVCVCVCSWGIREKRLTRPHQHVVVYYHYKHCLSVLYSLLVLDFFDWFSFSNSSALNHSELTTCLSYCLNTVPYHLFTTLL